MSVLLDSRSRDSVDLKNFSGNLGGDKLNFSRRLLAQILIILVIDHLLRDQKV